MRSWGETIEGSRTMRNRPYPVLKCSRGKGKGLCVCACMCACVCVLFVLCVCACACVRVCVCGRCASRPEDDHERAASAIAPQTPASAVSSACTSTQKRRYMRRCSRHALSINPAVPQTRWRDRTAVRSGAFWQRVRFLVSHRILHHPRLPSDAYANFPSSGANRDLRNS